MKIFILVLMVFSLFLNPGFSVEQRSQLPRQEYVFASAGYERFFDDDDYQRYSHREAAIQLYRYWQRSLPETTELELPLSAADWLELMTPSTAPRYQHWRALDHIDRWARSSDHALVNEVVDLLVERLDRRRVAFAQELEAWLPQAQADDRHGLAIADALVADLDLLVHAEAMSAYLLASRQDASASDRLYQAVLAQHKHWEVVTDRLFAAAPQGFLGIRQDHGEVIRAYRQALQDWLERQDPREHYSHDPSRRALWRHLVSADRRIEPLLRDASAEASLPEQILLAGILAQRADFMDWKARLKLGAPRLFPPVYADDQPPDDRRRPTELLRWALHHECLEAYWHRLPALRMTGMAKRGHPLRAGIPIPYALTSEIGEAWLIALLQRGDSIELEWDVYPPTQLLPGSDQLRASLHRRLLHKPEQDQPWLVIRLLPLYLFMAEADRQGVLSGLFEIAGHLDAGHWLQRYRPTLESLLAVQAATPESLPGFLGDPETLVRMAAHMRIVSLPQEQRPVAQLQALVASRGGPDAQSVSSRARESASRRAAYSQRCLLALGESVDLEPILNEYRLIVGPSYPPINFASFFWLTRLVSAGGQEQELRRLARSDDAETRILAEAILMHQHQPESVGQAHREIVRLNAAMTLRPQRGEMVQNGMLLARRLDRAHLPMLRYARRFAACSISDFAIAVLIQPDELVDEIRHLGYSPEMARLLIDRHGASCADAARALATLDADEALTQQRLRQVAFGIAILHRLERDEVVPLFRQAHARSHEYRQRERRQLGGDSLSGGLREFAMDNHWEPPTPRLQAVLNSIDP